MHLIWEAPVFLGRPDSLSIVAEIKGLGFRRTLALALAILSLIATIVLMLGFYPISIEIGPRWNIILFFLALVSTTRAAKKYDYYDERLKRWRRMADQDLEKLCEALGLTPDKILTSSVESLKELAHQKLLAQDHKLVLWVTQAENVTIQHASSSFSNRIWDFIGEEGQELRQKVDDLRQIFQEFKLLDQ